jgi:hypothetical protein
VQKYRNSGIMNLRKKEVLVVKASNHKPFLFASDDGNDNC